MIDRVIPQHTISCASHRCRCGMFVTNPDHVDCPVCAQITNVDHPSHVAEHQPCDCADEERQSCPRRMHEPGTWPKQAMLDSWWRNQWGNQWESPLPQPRVCSFCGSVHFDDLKILLEGGWIVVATTKGYKGYAMPFKLAVKLPEPRWSPVPPVKFYSHHFADEQVDWLNERLRKQ